MMQIDSAVLGERRARPRSHQIERLIQARAIGIGNLLTHYRPFRRSSRNCTRFNENYSSRSSKLLTFTDTLYLSKFLPSRNINSKKKEIQKRKIITSNKYNNNLQFYINQGCYKTYTTWQILKSLNFEKLLENLEKSWSFKKMT